MSQQPVAEAATEEAPVAPGLTVGFDRLEVVPHTGDPRVDDALSRLEELAQLPVTEHLSVYEDVHRRLHDALADLDAG